YKIRGVERAESLTKRMDSPLIESLKYLFFLISLSDANDAPPSLMGLWEEQSVSPSFKGLELGNESPSFKWE
ncbi:hypothetical protein WIW71_12805, partial [Stygiolobus sp. CP8521M]